MFKPMSPKQKQFILDLLERSEPVRMKDAYTAGLIETTWKTMRIAEDPEERQVSSQEASFIIDELLKIALPRVYAKATAPAYPEVPKGRYGIRDSAGALRFFRVTHSRKGFTHLAEVKDVTHSGRPRHIPIRDRNMKKHLLEAILAGGLNEGMALYGQHLGQCGRCNHTLTDDYSRLAGIGPHCRYILGIPVDPVLQRQAKAEELQKAHPAALVHVG